MERVSFEGVLRLPAPGVFILTDGPATAQSEGRSFLGPDGGTHLSGPPAMDSGRNRGRRTADGAGLAG